MHARGWVVYYWSALNRLQFSKGVLMFWLTAGRRLHVLDACISIQRPIDDDGEEPGVRSVRR